MKIFRKQFTAIGFNALDRVLEDFSKWINSNQNHVSRVISISEEETDYGKDAKIVIYYHPEFFSEETK